MSTMYGETWTVSQDERFCQVFEAAVWEAGYEVTWVDRQRTVFAIPPGQDEVLWRAVNIGRMAIGEEPFATLEDW